MRMPESHFPSLAGRHVLVTGGSSGIGAAIVEAFVRQDATVTFLDVQEPEDEGAASDCFVRCDLTDLDSLERAMRDAARERGPVGVLVNNAASDDRHTLQDVTPEYFDQRMAVNLRHFVFAARAVVPSMQERNRDSRAPRAYEAPRVIAFDELIGVTDGGDIGPYTFNLLCSSGRDIVNLSCASGTDS